MFHHRTEALALLGAGAALATPLRGDDLTASDRLLCTAWHAARCTAAGDCEATEPWRLNIPDFVRIELSGKTMTTTAAHSETRSTPIGSVHRNDGLIVLNGQQGERAWSWVINEASGEGTLSISSEGAAIAVFSACTPIESLTAEAEPSGGASP